MAFGGAALGMTGYASSLGIILDPYRLEPYKNAANPNIAVTRPGAQFVGTIPPTTASGVTPMEEPVETSGLIEEVAPEPKTDKERMDEIVGRLRAYAERSQTTAGGICRDAAEFIEEVCKSTEDGHVKAAKGGEIQTFWLRKEIPQNVVQQSGERQAFMQSVASDAAREIAAHVMSTNACVMEETYNDKTGAYTFTWKMQFVSNPDPNLKPTEWTEPTFPVRLDNGAQINMTRRQYEQYIAANAISGPSLLGGALVMNVTNHGGGNYTGNATPEQLAHYQQSIQMQNAQYKAAQHSTNPYQGLPQLMPLK